MVLSGFANVEVLAADHVAGTCFGEQLASDVVGVDVYSTDFVGAEVAEDKAVGTEFRLMDLHKLV